MAEVRIYKLDLTAGDIAIAHSTVFWPTAHGGTDSSHANYPELSKSENIQRRENFGALGQHVVDATNTADYTTAYLNLCEVGDKTLGQYDARGGTPLGHGPLKVRWRQKFDSGSLAESSVRVAIVLAHGMTGGTDHPTATGNIFLQLWAVQSSGANFDWHCRFRKVNGAFFSLTVNNIDGSADVADDAEHECILTLVPATVTGAYNGSGGLGSASVAADGSITLTVDGVQMLQGTGLQFVINQLATTNPEVYYGRGVWHGDNGSLLGHISDTELYYETTAVSEVDANETTPCCSEGTYSPDEGTNPGEVLGENPYIAYPIATAACSGGGTVPTAADPADVESWLIV